MSKPMSWLPLALSVLILILLGQNLLNTFSLQAKLSSLQVDIHAIEDATKGHTADPLAGDLAAKLDQHLKEHDTLRGKINALTQEHEALHQKLVRHSDDIKQKLDDQADTTEKISAKLDGHANNHEEMNNKLEAHAVQHDEMAGKLAEAHSSLAAKIEDQSKGLHAKLDAQKDVATYDLPGGNHLTAPWKVNGTTVYMDDKYLFRLDAEGHIRFHAPGINHVQIHVGSGNATNILPLLETNKSLFIFAVSPMTPREHLARSPRFALIPAGVHHTPQYQKWKGKQYPVIRLEQLIQLIAPTISVEVIKIYEGHDHMDILSTGHFITQLPRIIMQLQDLPMDHPAKRPHVQNTTAAIRKMKQKGIHALCCRCLQADTWDLECYFARRSFMNMTSDWPKDVMQISHEVPEGCHNPVDKHTNQVLAPAQWKKVWSVPMCKANLPH